jgi:phage portal protein BeeE
MPNLLTRLLGGRSVTPEAKSGHMLMAIRDLGAPDWTRRSFPALAQEGVMRNPVVHRCVRLIAEGAARVPLVAREAGKRLEEHPLPALLRRPNPHQSGSELLEAVYAYLQTAGNAYLHAAVADGEVKGLFGLRPDRMQAVVGRDGYAEAYAYTAGGRTQTLRQDTRPVPGVLHMSLFHPLDDHYGLAPLEAAQTSLDLHNAAREIALAFGVPPMLLGIPGDATYANMAEANKALWRQTIVPLVRRVADDLSFWLEPAFAGVTLEADFDGIEVLSEDQASRWARIGGAGFLSDEEKRELLGVGG